jgi:hypothetical protein
LDHSGGSAQVFEDADKADHHHCHSHQSKICGGQQMGEDDSGEQLCTLTANL